MSNGQQDLCIASINANRYRCELQDLIGMFVATLPYRIRLDPYGTFEHLVEQVRDLCLSILEHSHYPLQHILNDSQLNSSNVSFLKTLFDFITVSLNINQLSFDGADLEQVPRFQTRPVTQFDLSLTFVYNPTLNNNKLSFRLVFSRDLFDETRVTSIAQRFKYLFQQLFPSNSTNTPNDTLLTPIAKLHLILPDEATEIESNIFVRQSNIINEGMFIIYTYKLKYNI